MSESVEAIPNVQSGSGSKSARSATIRVMRAGSEDIVVGENSSLEGSFETQGSMFVDGSLAHADLKASLLSIGVAGSVGGNATVGRAEIAGSFDGHLVVSGEVILRSTARIIGDVQCGKLISHRGAAIRANVTVVEDEGELADMAQEARPFQKIGRPLVLSNSFLTRIHAFVYGVFFTLGSIGIFSLIFG